ncbi:hypothetical protein H0H87_000115 [Tephrocybe sp. NHM501043]|nr:hypothetical protein H0H87_000115 [Tephrocybe sp. NHM501043]
MASSWRLESINSLLENLNDTKNPLTEALLICGRPTYEKLATLARQVLAQEAVRYSCSQLEILIEESRKSITSHVTGKVLAGWMRVYTDSCLLRSLADLGPHTALESIARLDGALITCGIAGCRVDIILSTIKQIQHTYLSSFSLLKNAGSAHPVHPEPQIYLDSCGAEILVLDDPPSLHSFQTMFSNEPFLIRRYARDWPALVEHPWRSAAYLKSVSGPGRVVPVEVGVDYTAQGWTQVLMGWDEFLACIDLDDQMTLSNSTSETSTVYLAQHDLSLQFPELLADMVIPDYVYALLDTPCTYQPPGNDERLVTSMWLGPKGTISPAHTVRGPFE